MLFAVADVDNSGSVEKDEFVRMHGGDTEGIYNLMDKNHDSQVTEDEWMRCASHPS